MCIRDSYMGRRHTRKVSVNGTVSSYLRSCTCLLYTSKIRTKVSKLPPLNISTDHVIDYLFSLFSHFKIFKSTGQN